MWKETFGSVLICIINPQLHGDAANFAINVNHAHETLTQKCLANKGSIGVSMSMFESTLSDID